MTKSRASVAGLDVWAGRNIIVNRCDRNNMAIYVIRLLGHQCCRANLGLLETNDEPVKTAFSGDRRQSEIVLSFST